MEEVPSLARMVFEEKILKLSLKDKKEGASEMLRKKGSGSRSRRLWSFVPSHAQGHASGILTNVLDHLFLFLPQPGASRILARPHQGGHIPQPQHLPGRY